MMEQLVPKLRFSNFKEDWKESTISSEFSIFNGYAFKSSDSTLEGVRWIKIADVDINKISNDNISYLPANYLNKYDKFSLKKGDYVIALTRPILNNRLKIAKIDDSSNNSLLNQRVGKIISDNNLDYVYYYLQQNNIINLINDKIAGNDPPNLSPKEINSIKFCTPILEEQTKIADFLGAVDNQLDILNQKKEKLNTYKKGVMQQLFSQQLRFKDDNGNDFPEWEEKTLGDIGKIVSGLTYSPKNIVDSGLIVLRSSNIQNNKLSFEDNVYVDVKKYNPVETDDILICVRNGSRNLIGKNALISENEKGLAFGAFMTVYRSTYNRYIFQWMQHSTYKDYVNKNLGATINSINGNDLKKFLIPFPSIEEQKKIADFLSAIDKQIETVSVQIQKTENYKKGLLQQMFV